MVDRDLKNSALAANTEAVRPQNNGTPTAAEPKPTQSGILDTVGNTPIIQLRKIFGDSHFTLFGKIEAMNPGGSIKDRSGLHMLREALASGEISRDTTIIELIGEAYAIFMVLETAACPTPFSSVFQTGNESGS